ncbi:MAG: hypothetical protein ACK549_12760, partial [Cyanobacteriota bacterium]
CRAFRDVSLAPQHSPGILAVVTLPALLRHLSFNVEVQAPIPYSSPVQRRNLALGGMVQIRTTVDAKGSFYSQWQADLTKMR